MGMRTTTSFSFSGDGMFALEGTGSINSMMERGGGESVWFFRIKSMVLLKSCVAVGGREKSVT